MSNLLTFEIEFKSDFHIGAGHGLGQQVDSALLRDPDGVPVIRGTVIEGLLRESLANLFSADVLQDRRSCAASGAKNGRSFCGQWGGDEAPCPVCAIFGSPRQAKRWQISSARPLNLAEPQKRHSGWLAGETAAQTTTRVRVNPCTRRAEDNKLFTREEGDGSLRYRFTAECVADDAVAAEEAAWLVAASRLLRNIGASKYRGRGECEIHLTDRARETALLDSFAARLRDARPQTIAQQAGEKTPNRITLPSNPDEHTYRLRVLVRADEPLLLARRAEAGNQFETLNVIPGAILRGALAWRVAHRAGADMSDHQSVAYRNFVDLFFRGAVRFSPLLPIQLSKDSIYQGYLALPAPRDLLTCELHPGFVKDKTEEKHGVWSMAWAENEPGDCPVCAQEAQARGLADPKVKLEAFDGLIPLLRDTTQEFKQNHTVEMHIRTEPNTGRVRTGDLFSYALLEPGQYFIGEITCADAALWTALQQMTGLKSAGEVNELRLGKASRRGYGKVSLVCEAATKSPWQGPALADRLTDPHEVVLTLVSDAVVTDPWGRFERGFDVAWLRRELKVPDGVAVTIASEDKLQRRFSAMRAVDAFNAKLGLPRARDAALAAGSSVRLAFTGVTQPELVRLLKSVEMAGIGLRRDEGFGRVVFNHPIHKDGADWEEGAIELDSLALGRSANDHDLAKLARFEGVWAEKLTEKLTAALKKRPKLFEDGRFEAVARLEHVSNATSQETAESVLNGLGDQDQVLTHRLLGRDKKNFYDTEGKPDVEQVRALLGELATLIGEQHVDAQLEPRLWRMGLQMLADRIAEPARRKAQEGR